MTLFDLSSDIPNWKFEITEQFHHSLDVKLNKSEIKWNQPAFS